MMKKTTKLTALLMGLLMAASVAMTACDGGGDACKEHSDANGDGVCDVCKATISSESDKVSESDSSSESESETEKTVTVSLTVKEQDGTPVPGIVMRIVLLDEWYDEDVDWEPVSITSDDNGAASVALAEGVYRLSYEILPENYIGGTVMLNVKEGMEPVALEVTNNTPDGTEEHPFFLSDGSLTMTFPSQTSYAFSLFIGDRRSVVIDNASVEVTMNGVTYQPDENGRVTVKIEGTDPEAQLIFTVTNKGDEQSVTLVSSSELGSMHNPIVIETINETAQEITATVPAGMIMYYSWTADKDVTLKVTSQDTTNNICIQNKTTGQTTAASDGTSEISLNVKAGDVIVLQVSVKLVTETTTELVFAVSAA